VIHKLGSISNKIPLIYIKMKDFEKLRTLRYGFGVWFIFILFISRKAMALFTKSGIKGLSAEKEAAALLFDDYQRGSTPRGSIKHL